MKIVSILLVCAITLTRTYGQDSKTSEVEQMSLEWGTLRINPYISFLIPYAETKEIKLPAILSIEGNYNIGNIADVRATVHWGSFKGITVGGLFHLKDNIANKKTKFIVAETGEKVYFYKGWSDRRVVFGPSADIKVGAFDETGLYARLQGGLEWQTYSRAYYKGYRSSINGFTSVKLQALVSKLSNAEYHNGKEEYTNRMGLGAMGSLSYVITPWRRVSFYGGLEAGYIVIPGVENDLTNGIENSKDGYILEIKLGASVRI